MIYHVIYRHLMADIDIKKLRSKLGLTQEQLAKALGVSWITVNRWERKKCSPSPLAVEKLRDLADRSSESDVGASKPSSIIKS
ncbi:MAG: putative transcriptional regulator [Acidobacteriota bacterium]|nr:putative transcriptional regulator [Acidobacteriota bacterium]